MRVAIIGCTHAGLAAANELVGHPDTTVAQLDDMLYDTPEALRAAGATVHLNHDVVAIDVAAHTLKVQDMVTKRVVTDHYDKLIYAAGSRAVVPPVWGVDEQLVLLCKTMAQAETIKATATTAKRIAIVGGGYVGVELAESYARTGHEVVLCQSGPQLINNYADADIAGRVADLLRAQGVTVRLNDRVTEFRQVGAQVQLVTAAGAAFTADLAVVCAGFAPETTLVREQLATTDRGALTTNAWLETSDPDVLAPGDCCVTPFNPANRDAYFPLASTAIRQGLIAGRNVFGHVQQQPGTQATTALRVFDHTLARTGMTAGYAARLGLPVRTVTYEGTARPLFMPAPTPITIVLVYAPDTQRVLGAQLFSTLDLTQSANALSILIQTRGTLEDLAYVDMLFNPYYNQPYHYLNLVAQQALAQEAAQGAGLQ